MREKDREEPEKPFRILPRLTPENEHFWTGGAKGELRFKRCRPCGHYIHPPSPRCPACLSKELEVAAVSGRATVLTYTVNHKEWIPGFPTPYVIAIVEIAEQPGLRLMTNLVNCPAEKIRIGMPVRVLFEERDDVHLPLFEPVAG
jgi:uncharacterized OB-fold protein